MKFLNKIIPKPPIEAALISMHIQKTAGTSFAEILKAVYTPNQVDSLHIQRVGGNTAARITYRDQPYTAQVFVNRSKVLHGHFHYKHISEIIQPSANTPIITWLRHPVDRVISAFRYANHIYRKELSETDPRLNILNSLKRSLMEYACFKANTNWIARYMEGAQLEDFHFIGIVEHYEEDMAYLAKLMGWKNYSIPYLNKTSSRAPVGPAQRRQIQDCHQEDMEIYEQVLALRKERKTLP